MKVQLLVLERTGKGKQRYFLNRKIVFMEVWFEIQPEISNVVAACLSDDRRFQKQTTEKPLCHLVTSVLRGGKLSDPASVKRGPCQLQFAFTYPQHFRPVGCCEQLGGSDVLLKDTKTCEEAGDETTNLAIKKL